MNPINKRYRLDRVKKMKKVVILGGGTGTFTVLSGLKKFNNLDITAIVTVADSGGSTGRLRDEFGYLPVGDFRMVLAALADTNGDSDIMRELFLYRFDKGTGLRGHNFGNLLLTALTDILGTEDRAFEVASKILRVRGRVLPITREDITLVAEYENGNVLVGEKHIDDPPSKHDGTQRIKKLKVQPKAKISPRSKAAIEEANLIVLGPGDLYTSLLANVVVGGVRPAFRKSKAKIVFALNLINKFGQTYDFKASDYLAEFEKYLKIMPDYVLVNKTPLPKRLLKKYEDEMGYPVKDDLKKSKDYKVIRTDLLAGAGYKRQASDSVKRSLIRHDSDKLAKHIYKLV